MTWNHDITSAPRGKTVTVTKLVADKNSASGRSVRDIEEYQRDDVILASKCGKVIKSYWIPNEKRFAGFMPDSEIVAWMAWPEHPHHSKADGGLNIVHKHTEIALASQGEQEAQSLGGELSVVGANAGGGHVTGHGNAHSLATGELVSASPVFILDDCGSGA